MRTAQSLYEQGYITYMRTDSVHLSEQAIAAARSCELYGKQYQPQTPSVHHKSKGAQEAHEAIRPAVKPSVHRRTKWSGTGTLRPDLETHRRYPNGRRSTNSNHGWAEDAFRPVVASIDFLVIYAPTWFG